MKWNLKLNSFANNWTETYSTLLNNIVSISSMFIWMLFIGTLLIYFRLDKYMGYVELVVVSIFYCASQIRNEKHVIVESGLMRFFNVLASVIVLFVFASYLLHFDNIIIQLFMVCLKIIEGFLNNLVFTTLFLILSVLIISKFCNSVFNYINFRLSRSNKMGRVILNIIKLGMVIIWFWLPKKILIVSQNTNLGYFSVFFRFSIIALYINYLSSEIRKRWSGAVIKFQE